MGRDRKGTRSHARLLCPFVKTVVVRLPWEPAGAGSGSRAPGAPGGEGQRNGAAGSTSFPTRSRVALAVRMRVREARGARRLRFALSAVSLSFFSSHGSSEVSDLN